MESSLALDDRSRVEAFAEVKFLSVFVVQHGCRIAANKNLARKDDVTAISNRQRFAFAMVGEQDRDPTLTQVGNDVLDAVNRHRIDPRERLIQQNQLGTTGKTPSDFQASTLPPRQRAGRLFSLARQPEHVQQFIRAGHAVAVGQRLKFQHRIQVLFARQFFERAVILWKVAHAVLCPFVKGPTRHIHTVENDFPFGRCDQSDSHTEARRFSGTVGPQQSDDFARIHME